MKAPTIYDVAVRHQAYIENVKNHEQDAIDPVMQACIVLLLAMLASLGYSNLGDIPKSKLRSFIAEFNQKVSKLIDKFEVDFTKELKAFSVIDTAVLAAVLSALGGKKIATVSQKETWSKIVNDIMPIGHTPRELLRDFLRSVKHQMVLLIKQAYSQDFTVAQVIEALKGTKDHNFKNGLLNKIKNQFNTVQQTLIQHIHQWLKYQYYQMLYTHYQWVAVLDSKTTDICRSRDGHIYEYGNGPRPPAHYNCRSTIVGIDGVMAYPTPNSFYAWIKQQPAKVQNDLLGTTQARRLRNGELTGSDVSKYTSANKLPPKGLLDKISNMLN